MASARPSAVSRARRLLRPPPPVPKGPWASVPSAGAGAGAGIGAGASGVGSGWGDTSGPVFATVGTGAAPPRTFVETMSVFIYKVRRREGSSVTLGVSALRAVSVHRRPAHRRRRRDLPPADVNHSVRHLQDSEKPAWALLRLLVESIGVFALLFYVFGVGEPQSNDSGRGCGE